MIWNFSSWNRLGTPRVSYSTLQAVSCSSASACTAVGSFAKRASSNELTLAERWNGTSWKQQHVPSPPGGPTGLISVSCPSATACTAVGSNKRGGFAEHWNGTRWTLQRVAPPARGPLGGMGSVSCWSATGCIATGGFGCCGHGKTVLERWNGTSWKVQRGPSRHNGLGLVSCSSATACTALGSSGGHLFAERWNGTSWKLQRLPGRRSDALLSVSCPSARSCTAVGLYFTGHRGGPFAERWNGSQWKIERVRNPPGGRLGSWTACPARRRACVPPSVISRAGLVSRRPWWSDTRSRARCMPSGTSVQNPTSTQPSLWLEAGPSAPGPSVGSRRGRARIRSKR